MKYKLIIVVLILTIVSASLGCIETVSDGEHNGQITAIQKDGVIWKTYGVYVKSDVSSSQEEKYCLEDSSLIPKIEQASKDRLRVTILYKDELFVPPWRCGISPAGIITDVKS